jgi:hypothetical protein
MPIMLALILGTFHTQVISFVELRLILRQVFNMLFLCWLVVSLIWIFKRHLYADGAW